MLLPKHLRRLCSLVAASTLGQVAGFGQISISPPSLNGSAAQLEVRAANDTWFTLQSSTDLATWQTLATQQVQLSDRAAFGVPVANGMMRQFYRAQTPPPLRLSPASADLAAGATVTISGVLNGVANNSGLTWSVVEAGGGSVTQGGVYTAPTAAGTYHVRAVSKTDASIVVTLTVNVITTSAAEQALYADAATYFDSVLGDALLIMKNGAVVYEHYTGTTTANSAHLLASGTKSFNVALFAMGEAMGIWTLDENVSQTITEWQGVTNKKDITIRHSSA